MQSVCLYNRSKLTSFARGSIKLDDWEGKINQIKADESRVMLASEQYSTLQIRSQLKKTADNGRQQTAQLQNIDLTIQNQTKWMEDSQEKREDNKCLADLCLRDPRHEKSRIQDANGGLLTDSYRWVLKHEDYCRWYRDDGGSLLWMYGDPGQGKTMLLCGLIDELQNTSMGDLGAVAYFLCQATDSSINNATSVLRGLIYLIVDQNRSLIHHVRTRYDQRGKRLFEDPSAWFALTEILKSILQDQNLGPAFLIVDALDECLSDRNKLLSFICETSSPRVRWIVSSRRWVDIEKQMRRNERKICLHLEPTADFMITAVDAYVRHKADLMARNNQYGEDTKERILNHLLSNANGTFLWAALVCQNIEELDDDEVPEKLHQFPAGLDKLYAQIISQIKVSDHAQICLKVLAILTILKRPVSLLELTSLMEHLEQYSQNMPAIERVIGHCRSYVILRKDKIYFVHQSAQDYLSQNFGTIFETCEEEVHYEVFAGSLKLLQKVLQRDMYHLRVPGKHIDEISAPKPDPLEPIAYACIHWIDHLMDSQVDTRHRECFLANEVLLIEEFLQKKFLNWLEVLSLLRNISLAIRNLRKLEGYMLLKDREQPLQTCSPEISGPLTEHTLLEVVKDSSRFLQYHRDTIERYPLQVYASALIFSPRLSVMSQTFQCQEPQWINCVNKVQDHWDPCLMTLINYDQSLRTAPSENAFFSPDGGTLVLMSSGNLSLWDPETGALRSRITEISEFVFKDPVNTVHYSDFDKTVSFTPDGQFIIAVHRDGLARVWNTELWTVTNTIDLDADGLKAYTVSPSGLYVVFIAEMRRHLQCYCVRRENGIGLSSFQWRFCKSPTIYYKQDKPRILFSPDEEIIVISEESSINVWDIEGGKLLHTLICQSPEQHAIQISPNGRTLVTIAPHSSTLHLWNLQTGAKIEFGGAEFHRYLCYVTFSPDNSTVAVGPRVGPMKLWDIKSSSYLGMLEGFSPSYASSIAFTPNKGKLIVAGGTDGILRIWNIETLTIIFTYNCYVEAIERVAFRPDGKLLVSGSATGMIKFWDMEQVQLGTGWSPTHRNPGTISSSLYSHNDQLIAFPSSSSITTWSCATRRFLTTDTGDYGGSSFVGSLANGGKFVTTGLDIPSIKCWDTITCKVLGEWHSPDTSDFYTSHVLLFSGSAETIAYYACGSLHLVDATVAPLRSKYLFKIDESLDPDAVHMRKSEAEFVFLHGRHLMLYNGLSGDLKSQQSIPEMRDGFSRLTLAFGKRLVAAGFAGKDGENRLQLLDLDSGKVRNIAVDGQVHIDALHFSPDGETLSSMEWSNGVIDVFLWDVSTGTRRVRLEGNPFLFTLLFSPNGERGSSSLLYNRSVVVWNLQNGQLLREIPNVTRLLQSSFAADSSLLQTNRGVIWCGDSTAQRQPSRLFVTEEWVYLDQHKLLRLPPDYGATNHAYVVGSTVIIGGVMGIMVIEFDLEKAAECLGIEYIPESSK